MAERKKYPYDEKAKDRITRCLKKNYSQIKVNVRKEVKQKYKAYAASKGLSLREIIISHIEEMIKNDGFVYDDSKSEKSDETEEQDGNE